jgi:hypothetical protein
MVARAIPYLQLLLSIRFPVITSSSSTPSTFCNGGTTNLVASPSSLTATTLLTENFEGVNSFSVVNVGTTTSGTQWILRTSPFTQTSNTYNSGSKFMLSNSAAGGSGSTTNTALVSPTVSTVNYSALSLTFNTYGKFIGGSSGNIEVSTNGGSSWIPVTTLPNTGSPSSFALATINLNAYINVSTLKFRLRYDAAEDDSWAVDDISLTGTPTVYNYSWAGSPSITAGLPGGAGTPSTTNNNIIAAPTATTLYTVTLTDAAGCTSSNTLNVTVNQPPSISIQPSAQSACSGNSASFSLTASGTNLTYQWRKGTTNLSNGGNISGATTATLTINPVGAGDVASNYNVVITGTCSPAVTSNNASLTFNNGPSFYVLPWKRIPGSRCGTMWRDCKLLCCISQRFTFADNYVLAKFRNLFSGRNNYRQCNCNQHLRICNELQFYCYRK